MNSLGPVSGGLTGDKMSFKMLNFRQLVIGRCFRGVN